MLSGGTGVAVGGGIHVLYAWGSCNVGDSGPFRAAKFVDSINGEVRIVEVEDSAGARECPAMGGIEGIGGIDGEGSGAKGALLGKGGPFGRGDAMWWLGNGDIPRSPLEGLGVSGVESAFPRTSSSDPNLAFHA